MEALEQFKKRIDSLIEKAYMGNVSLLSFLDEAMQGILISEMKYHSMIKCIMDGGFINSDRKRAIIAPEEYNNLDYRINVYKIKYNNKFYTLNHRQILGTLMSLGIKRECIGDIVFNNENWYIAVTKEISSYIIDSFKYVGKAPIELELFSSRIENIIRYEDKTYFLSSLRLDCVIASSYNISRSDSQSIISEGNVFINQINSLNNSHILKENDIISIRHKGKIRITAIGNETKSGRIACVISKRI